MRLQLNLDFKLPANIPFNYNYQFSAIIYDLLRLGSDVFSTFLHDTGFNLKGRRYKLFTFSLHFDKYIVQPNNLKLISSKAKLFVSSPLIDSFIQNFVIGTFKKQEVDLVVESTKTKFNIDSIESLPELSLFPKTKFNMLSPLVLSTVEEKYGNLSQYYFRTTDNLSEINHVFNQNLINKYKLIFNKEYSGTGLKFYWDEEYLSRKFKQNKKVTKKVSITKPGSVPIEIVGNEAPFYLEGDTQLMKVGYDCGFGEKNSMGFGLAETNLLCQ